jgi:glycosyltransferase involved in cell wall biosynthesis
MAGPLRVALVHSYYDSRQPNGENIQVDAEHRALADAGHEVALFAAHTADDRDERFYRLRSALRVATRRGTSPLDALRAFRPDVVHVHNLFPNFGRHWALELEVPLVVTLHNFRFVCAAGSLYRDGARCTDCPDGRPTSALRHRCYRGSVAATAPLVIANRGGPAADPVIARADRLLCILPRQQAFLVRAGIAPHRIVAWTNFLPDRLVPPDGSAPGTGCLYVGRLTAEKGILGLVATWTGDVPLTVVGDGPQRDEVERAAKGRHVAVLGPRPREDVLTLVRSSAALAVPSLWPEAMTLTGIEALACGVPLVMADDAEVAADITDHGVGRVVSDPAEYAAAAAALAGDSDVRSRCRALFEARYTEAAWVERITALYRSLVDRSQDAGGPTHEMHR